MESRPQRTVGCRAARDARAMLRRPNDRDCAHSGTGRVRSRCTAPTRLIALGRESRARRLRRPGEPPSYPASSRTRCRRGPCACRSRPSVRWSCVGAHTHIHHSPVGGSPVEIDGLIRTRWKSDGATTRWRGRSWRGVATRRSYCRLPICDLVLRYGPPNE
jgi:hypothetical protein